MIRWIALGWLAGFTLGQLYRARTRRDTPPVDTVTMFDDLADHFAGTVDVATIYERASMVDPWPDGEPPYPSAPILRWSYREDD